MPSDRTSGAKAVFMAALDVAPAELEGFVQSQCGGDDALLAEVWSLLHHHAEHDGTERERSGIVGRAAAAAGFAPRPSGEAGLPASIGPFRIVRLIGEGGMASVYEAEQDRPRRRIALKVIRAGLPAPSLLRRFEFEAEVLGRLHHPCVAQVFASGAEATPSGPLPWLAMEYVEGRPLVEHARARGLGLHERLQLFARVCDGVHHAHVRGVIHRDLKPANILVDESEGGAGTPKILDFGVARATGGDHAPGLHTQAGQIVGTLAYMSPEQVSGRPDEIDVRTDVYALGVILYELCAEKPPVELGDSPLTEAARRIREEEPPRLGHTSAALRGDLETIAACALAKDRERRYASAAELAADIRRHLRDEPIAARPATLRDLALKFARRHRPLVAGALTAIAAVLVGAGVSIWQAVAATRAREAEARERSKAERLAEAMAEKERQSARLSYRSVLTAAAAALRNHDPGTARRVLDEADVDARGFEWRHLRAETDHSLTTMAADDGRPATAEFLGSGDRLLVWYAEGRARVFAVETGAIAGAIEAPGPVRVSADGRFVVAAPPAAGRGKDPLRLFAAADLSPAPAGELPEAERRRSWWHGFPDHQYPPGGSLVDPRTGVEPAPRGVPLHPAGPVDLVPTLPVDGPPRLVFVEPVTGEPRGEVPIAGLMDGVPALSADGTRAAMPYADATAHVHETATGRRVAVLRGHEAGVACAAFAPDGNLVATASVDGTLRVWDPATGTGRTVLHGVSGRAHRIAWSANGRRLATLSHVVQVWEIDLDEPPRLLRHGDTIYPVAFTQDGLRLVTGSLDQGGPNIHVFDVATGAKIAAWQDGLQTLSLALSPDGLLIAAGTSGGKVRVYDAGTGALLRELSPDVIRGKAVAFTPDGAEVLVLDAYNRLRRFGLEDGRTLVEADVAALFGQDDGTFALGPGGRLLAVASVTGRGARAIGLADARTFAPAGSLEGHEAGIWDLAFSPDGRRLASASDDGTVRVWDVAERRPAAVLRGHRGPVLGVAWSPDGTRLASGSRDRTVRLWDAVNYESLVELRGPSNFVYRLAFSPDGRRLATSGGDDLVRIWDTVPVREVFRARDARQILSARLRPRVQALFDAPVDPTSIPALLRADTTIDPATREIALQSALAESASRRR